MVKSKGGAELGLIGLILGAGAAKWECTSIYIIKIAKL